MAAAAGRYVTVYLLDDHDIVRQGLRDLLAPAREVHVVGDSGRAEHAAEAILERGAMVMVLDLQLQDGSGVHVCRQVRAVNPNVQGLLLTSADDDAALAAAVLAGAAGCLVKLTRSNHILTAVRELGAGRSLIDEVLTARAARHLLARAEAAVPALSDREMELLRLVLAGQTDREISESLDDDLALTQEDVGRLIARMLATPRETSRPDPVAAPAGKHRRPT